MPDLGSGCCASLSPCVPNREKGVYINIDSETLASNLLSYLRVSYFNIHCKNDQVQSAIFTVFS